jgi:phage portal protein BeeE
MVKTQGEKIPAFDKFNKDEKCQLLVYQGYSPGLEYYSQPIYANAANWIFLDGQISYYHKSNIENSLNPSLAIKIYEKPANDEEKQQFIRQLQASFGGAANSGRAMVFYSNGKDLSPDIQSIDPNTLDEAFAITQEMIVKNIAFSHTIDPVIMGISTPGALGQSQQLETAYNIFDSTFVKPNQKWLNNILNFYLTINNLPATVTLNNYKLF